MVGFCLRPSSTILRSTRTGRGTGNPGRLEFRVEKRAAPGGWLAPQELGSDLGAAALNTGFAYSDSFDTDLSVLNWTQGFYDQRIGIAVG